MLCDLTTMALATGHYRHVCRRPGCGRDVQTAAAACRLRCRAAVVEVPDVLAVVPPREFQRRRQICSDCTEHPGAGCWKDREYGCQRAYREAARHAAEMADCPIGKL